MAKSYVISVSVYKGCYRHVQVPADWTLEDLSDVILDLFDFDNDHLHAFFMDNKAWSDADCYTMDYGEATGERYTHAYTLEQLHLTRGKQFLYLFDFGDSWQFQCKVLKELDESGDEAVVIKEVGESPEQYPNMDEGDWDDDDEDDEDEE